MEKVVYSLGAGFSAPLGIPVMGNFLTRSKDLYFTDPQRYADFLQVFDTINELSVIKNYYSADLFNIEEILSILEMRDYLEGEEGLTITSRIASSGKTNSWAKSLASFSTSVWLPHKI